MPSGIRDQDTPYPNARCKTPEHFRPPAVYGTSLTELDRYSLEIECACGHRGNIAIVALTRVRKLGMRSLGQALPRLKCGQCKAPPSSVLLNECMCKHFAYGPPRGWSQQVWPMNG